MLRSSISDDVRFVCWSLCAGKFQELPIPAIERLALQSIGEEHSSTKSIIEIIIRLTSFSLIINLVRE